MRSRRRESRAGFNSRGRESGVSHLAKANLTMSDAVCRTLLWLLTFGSLKDAGMERTRWSATLPHRRVSVRNHLVSELERE